MPGYLIYYSFAGAGRVRIEADSEEDASAKFKNGDWTRQKEEGDEYTIQVIESCDC